MRPLVSLCNNLLCKNNCRVGCIQFGKADYCSGCEFTFCYLSDVDFIKITVFKCKEEYHG